MLFRGANVLWLCKDVFRYGWNTQFWLLQLRDVTTVTPKLSDILKFGHSEKATKIWNNLPLDLTFTGKIKSSGRLFQILGTSKVKEWSIFYIANTVGQNIENSESCPILRLLWETKIRNVSQCLSKWTTWCELTIKFDPLYSSWSELFITIKDYGHNI